MATIAIFGGTGYAGSAIRDEAVRRGHRVISITRSGAPDGGTPQAPNLEFRQGTVHDAALVDRTAAEADVIVVSIRFAPTPEDVKLIDAFPALTSAASCTVPCRNSRFGVSFAPSGVPSGFLANRTSRMGPNCVMNEGTAFVAPFR